MSAVGSQADGVNTYCITFGTQDVNVLAFVQYLYDSNDVIAFWNYVPLVYCIKSRLSSYELAVKVTPFFPHGTFFIAEVNVYNVDGRLSNAAWEWFYLDHHQKTPTNALAGLLSPPKA